MIANGILVIPGFQKRPPPRFGKTTPKPAPPVERPSKILPSASRPSGRLIEIRDIFFSGFVSGTRTTLWGDMVGWTMPTNTLRTQASRFLHLALKAHDEDQLMDAHQFTVKAAELLEGAVSLEELRKATSRASTSSLPSRNSYSTKSGEKLDNGGRMPRQSGAVRRESRAGKRS